MQRLIGKLAGRLSASPKMDVFLEIYAASLCNLSGSSVLLTQWHINGNDFPVGVAQPFRVGASSPQYPDAKIFSFEC